MVKNNSKRSLLIEQMDFLILLLAEVRGNILEIIVSFGRTFNLPILEGIWSNRLAQRISSLPAEAALKNGYKIEGDKDNLIIQYLDERLAESILAEALTWARHFGRSCIL